MPDAAVLFLADEVRTRTLRLIEGVSDEQARYAPPGLNNTILWNAGHAYVLIEHLAMAPATGAPPDDPPGWFETFSWKSRPALVRDWPALDDVVKRLGAQHVRLMRLIEQLTPAQLDRVMPNGRILRDLIVHGLHDEAQHQGEIYLLRKMLAAGARTR